MAYITFKLKSAQSAEMQADLYKEFSSLNEHLSTCSNLAYIRFSLNTNDKFYSNEIDFYDRNLPVMSEYGYNLACEMIDSPYRTKLEKLLSTVLFKGFECVKKSFSPVIIGEIQEDNGLISEYSRFLASAQIEFDGQVLNISQLGKYKESPDPDIRKRAVMAQGEWMKKYSGQFDTIFDRMVKVRDRMSKKLGYKNYAELSLYRMGRIGYGAKELNDFRSQVLEKWVPFVAHLKEKQAKELGIAQIRMCDDTIWFKHGNPEPQCAVNDMFENGKRMYHEMSKSTGLFIDYMLENDLFDVIARKGKSGGGYCSELPEYKMPFIFANFNGTYADVDVLTHEAGHAYAAYEAMQNIPLYDLRQAGMETCEVHSMSMEFFAWKWMNLFFKDKADAYRYMHLANAVSFIPYGIMVDYFQQIVYENPEMIPEQRKQLWLRLEKQFRPYMSFDGLTYMDEGGRWQCQAHIYENPFYYIDYCLAQMVAFNFLIASQKDYTYTFELYTNFLKKGGSEQFCDLVKNAGFKSVFDPCALDEIIAGLKKYCNI